MPCKLYQPVLAELKKEGMNIEFIDIGANENRKKISEKGISGVPVTIIYKDDKEWERIIGVQSSENIKYLMSE